MLCEDKPRNNCFMQNKTTKTLAGWAWLVHPFNLSVKETGKQSSEFQASLGYIDPISYNKQTTSCGARRIARWLRALLEDLGSTSSTYMTAQNQPRGPESSLEFMGTAHMCTGLQPGRTLIHIKYVYYTHLTLQTILSV